VAGVSVAVDLAPLLAPLARLGYTPQELTPALNGLRQLLLTDSRDCFNTGTDPDGKAWAPLKSRRGRPLLDTGRLRGAVTARVEGARAVVSNNTPYAGYHQGGTRRAPRRAFLGAGARVEPKIARLLNGFVDKLLRGGA
jgi:phage gpG-like protein